MYVYDTLIKSRSLNDQLVNLEEKFIMIKNNKVRINPAKCMFGVIVKKFLGFMLTKRGLEENLAKCKAILEMRSATTINEV